MASPVAAVGYVPTVVQEDGGPRTYLDVRGLLAVPRDADAAAAYERSSYVTAMRAANAGAYNPW